MVEVGLSGKRAPMAVGQYGLSWLVFRIGESERPAHLSDPQGGQPGLLGREFRLPFGHEIIVSADAALGQSQT